MTASFPANETARLEALRRYEILDTVSEQAFDEITMLAGDGTEVVAFVRERPEKDTPPPSASRENEAQP